MNSAYEGTLSNKYALHAALCEKFEAIIKARKDIPQASVRVQSEIVRRSAFTEHDPIGYVQYRIKCAQEAP